MTIRSNINKAGKAQGMKLVEFCRRMDALGISRNTAVKVWHDNTNVMLPVYLAACQVLGVTLNDVLTVKVVK
jgi:DNA-binding Xre family transcriptional regulator